MSSIISTFPTKTSKSLRKWGWTPCKDSHLTQFSNCLGLGVAEMGVLTNGVNKWT